MAEEKQSQFLSAQAQEPPPSYTKDIPDSLGSPPPSKSMKIYSMYYTLSRCSVTLHLGRSSSSTTPIYFGEISWRGFVSNKPQLQLRAGSSKSAPIIGAAKLHTMSRDIQLGLGNPQEDVTWEDMRRENTRFVRSDYEMDSAIGITSGVRKTYGWRREKHMAKTVYRCVDEEGQVFASLFSGGMLNWKKGGEVEVAEGVDKKLEELLILSALTIFCAEAGWSACQGYKSKGAAGDGSA